MIGSRAGGRTPLSLIADAAIRVAISVPNIQCTAWQRKNVVLAMRYRFIELLNYVRPSSNGGNQVSNTWTKYIF
jgi:hypothetical protein